MTKNAESVLMQALTLGESERAEIAGALLESLEPAADVSVEAAWREEVRRRLDPLDAGTGEFIPWEDVREQLIARLHDQS